MTSNLPSGTVTFLFTDIEGSTQLWEKHPDAMKTAVARHAALLHAAIGDHRGQFIKSTGDGLYAVFASATDGANAVVASQRALLAEAWPLPRPIRVRMGLHTGEAELREGDYFGPALNRTARLMAVGAGGQCLLSQATAQQQTARAATLFGLAEMAHSRVHHAIAGPGRALADAALASVREALDLAAFAEAFTAGQKLSLDEAFAIMHTPSPI